MSSMRLNMPINNLTLTQVKMVRRLAYLAETALDDMIERFDSAGNEEGRELLKQRRDEVVDLWHRCASV